MPDEMADKAAMVAHELGILSGVPFNCFFHGAAWANEQNAAELAALKFRVEGDAILLQAANQTIEKERAKISELEKYRDNNLRTIVALQDEKAEMLAFLENVGSPKRKSDEEGWDIFEIARRARALVKKYRNG